MVKEALHDSFGWGETEPGRDYGRFQDLTPRAISTNQVHRCQVLPHCDAGDNRSIRIADRISADVYLDKSHQCSL